MTVLRDLRARLRDADPFRVDVGIAALLCAAVLVETALADVHGASRPVGMVLGVAMLAWLALRRRSPFLAACGLSLTLAASIPIGGTNNIVLEYLTTAFFGVLLALYSVARHLEGPRLWAAAALVYVTLAVGIGVTEEEFEVPGDVIWLCLLFGLPVLAGRALRGRELLQRELREKAERTEAEHAERARRAIEEERDRVASELQAVIANGISAMVVQAGAVPRVLAAGDVTRAADAFGVIEETGRDALAEMRRLLGVLRREGDSPALAPQPGLDRLESLVGRLRERGLRVEITMEGSRRPLSPGVDLTAYRVLEDTLDAAADGDASAASLLLRFGEGELELEVRDDRVSGGSRGLSGLRERVAIYGGHIDAGQVDGGGFRLWARLPLEKVLA